MKWLARLRTEWSKNDGKPVHEWAPGPDLKDITLRAAAVVLGVVQIGLIVWWMIKPIWK